MDKKNILVTGGTGSFGNAFVEHVLAKYTPNRVVIYSRDEFKQFQMAQKFNNHPVLRFFIGDVRDIDRLQFATNDIDIRSDEASRRLRV
jgi:UDP-N-acetylglucosamine 4,6-dehydratase